MDTVLLTELKKISTTLYSLDHKQQSMAIDLGRLLLTSDSTRYSYDICAISLV